MPTASQSNPAVSARGLMVLLALALLLVAGPAPANTRIKDLCEIQGARGNTLRGIGLVVGLNGTGDSASAAIRAQERVLERMTVDIDSVRELASDNIAVVTVTAMLPAFAKAGTRIDVQVQSLYDADSLQGGTLLETLLYGMDDRVYAVAQGGVSLGGFAAGGQGAGVQQNHVTAGRIPMGAFIEREVPATITDGERLMLLLKQADFTTANNIQNAIEERFGQGSAYALTAGSVAVRFPPEAQGRLVQFIADLEQIPVEAGHRARVVVNERTGTIVVGGDVRIRPSQVAHGNLTITIAATPVISQPLPLAPGETVVTDIEELEAVEQEAYLMPVEGASAAEVAQTLNRLKVTPRDMIAIFQALREAGALQADLEIM